MFPLAGKTFPASSDQLAAGIRDALAELFLFPDKNAVVAIAGGKWPALGRVGVNLSGATIRISQAPPRPEPRGDRERGITIDQLEVLGHPIGYERSKLDLQVNARGLRLDFAHDATGQALLVLADASEGRVAIKVAKSDLQAMLLAGATAAAKQQGVAVQDLQLSLTSASPRSIAVEVRVKAKKMIMSGVVTIRGRVDIDDRLVATLSGLACTGEGMIGTMAAAMIGGKLKEMNGKRLPLMAFSLGDVSLRDLQITATDQVQINAEFGGKA